MILNRVTITGADDDVNPEDLIQIHKEFPFVELGFLFEPKRQGGPRYPSESWMVKYLRFTDGNRPKISAHFCGEHVKNLINDKCVGLFLNPFFDRFQLNMTEKTFSELDFLVLAENTWKQLHGAIILQSKHGFQRGADVLHLNKLMYNFNMLYDASGGKGIVINSFPAPYPGLFCGYAGGLNPDNLSEKLEKISEVVKDSRIWIDIESGVRDSQNKFDLKRVKECLSICARWMSG